MVNSWLFCCLLLIAIVAVNARNVEKSRRVSTLGRRTSKTRRTNNVQIAKSSSNISLCRLLTDDTIQNSRRSANVVEAGNKGSSSVMQDPENMKTIVCRGETYHIKRDEHGNLLRISSGGSAVVTNSADPNKLLLPEKEDNLLLSSSVGSSLSADASRKQISASNNIQDKKSSSSLTRTTTKKVAGGLKTTGEYSAAAKLEGKTWEGETRNEDKTMLSRNPKQLRLKGYKKLDPDTKIYMNHEKMTDFEMDL